MKIDQIYVDMVVALGMVIKVVQFPEEIYSILENDKEIFKTTDLQSLLIFIEGMAVGSRKVASKVLDSVTFESSFKRALNQHTETLEELSR